MQRLLKAIKLLLIFPCRKTYGTLMLTIKRFLFGDAYLLRNGVAVLRNFYNTYYSSENGIVRLGRFSFAAREIFSVYSEAFDIMPDEMTELDRAINSVIFEHDGPYEEGSFSVKEGDIVIDAGANLGIFAINAAAKGASVYAFEPQAQLQETLKENIKLNGLEDRITVVPFGLSSANGEMIFAEIDNMSEIGRFASLTESQGLKDSFSGCRTYSIRTVSLDSWAKENAIEHIDFIKSDIEGAERDLLKGASAVMKRFQPKLSICTYHLPDDPEVLEKIILDANPGYIVSQRPKKLFAQIKN